MSVTRVLGQALFWAAVLLPVGLFAQWPRHAPVAEGLGQLTLSLAHLTQRLSPCRQLSEAERADLPPNMRAFEVCERERAPARIELRLDGRALLAEDVAPAGLHRDGRAYLHRVWALPAGRHALELRLRDTPRGEGFDRVERFALQLDPGVAALLRVGDGDAHLHPGALPPES